MKKKSPIELIFDYAAEMISYIDEIDRAEKLEKLLAEARADLDRLLEIEFMYKDLQT